jgi:hypothetical protein
MLLRVGATSLLPRARRRYRRLLQITKLALIRLLAHREHVQVNPDALVMVHRADARIVAPHIAALRNVLCEPQVHH